MSSSLLRPAFAPWPIREIFCFRSGYDATRCDSGSHEPVDIVDNELRIFLAELFEIDMGVRSNSQYIPREASEIAGAEHKASYCNVVAIAA